MQQYDNSRTYSPHGKDGTGTNRNSGSKSLKAMIDAKMWGLNILWATWGAAVWLADLNYIIAIIGGVTLIWVNIEKAITHRQNRDK